MNAHSYRWVGLVSCNCSCYSDQIPEWPCGSVWSPTPKYVNNEVEGITLALFTAPLSSLSMSSENSPASPKTIAFRLGLDVKELDKSCDEFLLPFLANFVHPWREVFAYLLAPIDLDDIDSENAGRSEQTKRLAGLRKWKVKCGAKATYGVLIASLLKNGDVQNAENICLQIMNSGNKGNL